MSDGSPYAAPRVGTRKGQQWGNSGQTEPWRYRQQGADAGPSRPYPGTERFDSKRPLPTFARPAITAQGAYSFVSTHN